MKFHLRRAHLHNKNIGVLEAVKQLPEDELVVVGNAVVHQGLSGAALDGLYQLYVLQVPAGGRHSFQVSDMQVHTRGVSGLNTSALRNRLQAKGDVAAES